MSKSYLRKLDTLDIEIMGQKVTIKNLSFRDARKAMNRAMNINQITGKADIDSGLLGAYRTLYSIVDWDLTDENGKKLPIELKTLDEVLSEGFVNSLMEKVNDYNSGVTEDKKKR